MIEEILETLFGYGEKIYDFNALQMGFRSLLIYCVAVFLVRVGNKRMMGRGTPFDLVIGIMLGSTLSRTLTGQVSMSAGIAGSAVLVAAHWFTGSMTVHFSPIDWLVKGKPRKLITKGEVDWKAMRKGHLDHMDLDEALRMDGRVTDPAKVESAHLEASGHISVLLKQDQPQVVEVKVEEGVQTIRLKIER